MVALDKNPDELAVELFRASRSLNGKRTFTRKPLPLSECVKRACHILPSESMREVDSDRDKARRFVTYMAMNMFTDSRVHCVFHCSLCARLDELGLGNYLYREAGGLACNSLFRLVEVYLDPHSPYKRADFEESLWGGERMIHIGRSIGDLYYETLGWIITGISNDYLEKRPQAFQSLTIGVSKIRDAYTRGDNSEEMMRTLINWGARALRIMQSRYKFKLSDDNDNDFLNFLLGKGTL